jgi:hypothetical protein
MREFIDPSPASWPRAVTVSNRLPQMRSQTHRKDQTLLPAPSTSTTAEKRLSIIK